MALASAKQLLDELMGRDRNRAPTDKKKDNSWGDPDVCKHFLVKFCPNELFVNTKADLGPCNKIHDERLKKEYETNNKYQQMGYEQDFLTFCQGMLADVEKRIRRARQRLALGHQEGGIAPPINPKNNSDEKVRVLTERINELLQQVEQLGCEGKVEEAQAIMKLCDQLKEERDTIQKDFESNHWLKQTAEIAAAQEKQMEVCDICGAFLIVGDAQQRVDDHLMGKQHVGYARLKEAVDEILGQREKERLEREREREREREDRRRKRFEEEEEARRRREDEEREKERRRREDRNSRRRRSRSRSKGRRTPSRDRDRERDRHRESHRRKESSRHKNRSRSRSRERYRDRKESHRNEKHSRDSREHDRPASNGDLSPLCQDKSSDDK